MFHTTTTTTRPLMLFIPTLLLLIGITTTNGFLVPSSSSSSSGKTTSRPFALGTTTTTTTQLFGRRNKERKRKEKEEEIGKGKNWIRRSSDLVNLEDLNREDPKATAKEAKEKLMEVANYTLGIDGSDFKTGDLSGKMYQVLSSQSPLVGDAGIENAHPDIVYALKMYAMDFTAQEATKAALVRNGMMLSLSEDDEYNRDIDNWGVVENIVVDGLNQDDPDDAYGSMQEACLSGWEPGMKFSFVVKDVPAKMKVVQLSDIMSALDPEGEMAQSTRDAGYNVPDEDLHTLGDMYYDNMRRCNDAPRGATTPNLAYAGNSTSRGYRIMERSALKETTATAEEGGDDSTMKHLMHSMVAHGALVVDISEDKEMVRDMATMWKTVESLFELKDTDPELAKAWPKMRPIPVAPTAVVGFQDTQDIYRGGMQFWETRWKREVGGEEEEGSSSSSLFPNEIPIPNEDLPTLQRAFKSLAEVGKDVIRVATAASTIENFGFVEANADAIANLEDEKMASAGSSSSPSIKAAQGAKLMVKDLIDDGTAVLDVEKEGEVSMSPHRFCRYGEGTTDPAEVFGGHTDTSFVTIIPVAAVSGLEVYDEEAEQWYRPELAAKRHWEDLHGSAMLFDDEGLPWHARYVAMLPGELLQVVTRNEVAAAVHRVVAGGSSIRFSAPVLLRARPGTTLDVPKYLGEVNTDLLETIAGQPMQEIYRLLQPSANQGARPTMEQEETNN